VSDYLFVTPSSYTPETAGQSFILVLRPVGVNVDLDGIAIDTDWQSLEDQEIGYVAVAGGVHRVHASAPIGLQVYGMGSYTSYAYPGAPTLAGR